MMMWMLRRRKMMKLRRMMLRRKTDPKTVMREPAPSKCTWTCHKRHLCGNLQGNRGQHFVRACAVEMHMDMGKCQTLPITPGVNTGH